MLDGLQTEIDRYPVLVGASNEIICRTINETPALVDTRVITAEVPK